MMYIKTKEKPNTLVLIEPDQFDKTWDMIKHLKENYDILLDYPTKLGLRYVKRNDIIVCEGTNIGQKTDIMNKVFIGYDVMIMPYSLIGNGSILNNNVKIGRGAAISNNVFIGSNALIGSNVVIGERSVIGNNTFIDNNVIIPNGTIIGSNCAIHSTELIQKYDITVIPDGAFVTKDKVIYSTTDNTDKIISTLSMHDRITYDKIRNELLQYIIE